MAADCYAESLRREPPKPLRAQPYLFLSRAYARAGKVAEAVEAAETVIKIATKLGKSVKQEQMEAYEDAQVVLERTLNHQCTALTSISEDVHRLRQQVAGNTLSDVLAKLSLKA